MGNLVTKGRATKEFEAEKMILTVIFQKTGDEAGYILDSVQQQCEEFLIELNKIKIAPENIELVDGGLDKHYSSEKPRAERKIIITTKIDILLCTYIFSLIKKCGNEIKYNIHFDVNNKEELSNQLIKLAVEDSRRQADIIAESLGCSITGVNSVNDQRYMHRNLAKSVTVEDDVNPEIPESFRSDTPLSDRAALPTIKLEEEIEICWNMSE